MNFPKNIDFSKISFGSVKTNDNGGKSIYIGYGGAPLIIQTPLVTTPFGMSVYNKDAETMPGEVVKYSAPVNLTDDTVSSANFKKFLISFDKEIINAAVKNSKDWLGKTQKEKVISAFYSPMVNFPKDKETGEIIDKYDPKFKLPLLVRDGVLITKCFNDEKEPVEVSDVPAKSSMRAIIQCTGIWIVGKRFGVSWKVLQLIVDAPNTMNECWLSDDEGDDEGCSALSDPVKEDSIENAFNDEFVQDEDDDDNEIIEVENDD